MTVPIHGADIHTVDIPGATLTAGHRLVDGKLLCDSRGRRSWAHTLAVPAAVVITLWFITGGLDITIGSLHVLLATRSAAEYALAVGVWLAFLGQREYTEKKLSAGGSGGA